MHALYVLFWLSVLGLSVWIVVRTFIEAERSANANQKRIDAIGRGTNRKGE